MGWACHPDRDKSIEASRKWRALCDAKAFLLGPGRDVTGPDAPASGGATRRALGRGLLAAGRRDDANRSRGVATRDSALDASL
eukprot:4372970-Pyramimonas_sp.AAC.1